MKSIEVNELVKLLKVCDSCDVTCGELASLMIESYELYTPGQCRVVTTLETSEVMKLIIKDLIEENKK